MLLSSHHSIFKQLISFFQKCHRTNFTIRIVMYITYRHSTHASITKITADANAATVLL